MKREDLNKSFKSLLKCIILIKLYVLSCLLLFCVYGDTVLKFTYLYTLVGRISHSVFVSSSSIPLYKEWYQVVKHNYIYLTI